MTSWLPVIPEIAFMVAILGLPGLLIARCLRFQWWDAAALSAPLSLGALALANIVAIITGVQWGLPVLLTSTAVIALICWGFTRLRARRAGEASPTEGSLIRLVDGVVWGRRAQIIALGATFAAVVVGAIVIARGTGTPHTLNQTHDGAFHINSIAAIAHQRHAAPSVLNNLGYTWGVGGFYPPTFAAAGALTVIYTGVSPLVAANVASVAIAIMWPLSASIAIRRLARPSAFGYVVAMVGTVTVGLFPAGLLAWGTVWPNALSVLTIAPALLLVVRVFGLDRSRDGAEDPHGPLAPRSVCLAAGAIMVPGMAFAQPQAVFATFFLCLPLVARWLWRRTIGPDPDLRRRLGIGATIVAALVVLVAALGWLSFRIPAMAAVGNYEHERASVWLALGQIISLAAHRGFPNIAFALLTIAGIYLGLRSARGRFLVGAYGVMAILYFIAAAVRTHVTNYLTGYWYNDAPRVFAILPVVGLPLAAMAADVVRVRVRDFLARRRGSEPYVWAGRQVTASTAAGLVVCLGILVLQAGLGTARVSQVVSENNQCKGSACVVTLGAQKLLAQVATTMKPGQTIAGNPYTGEILAAQFAVGHDVIYPTWGVSKDPTAAFVALTFRDYRQDRLVCAAVKALNIGVIVTGRKFHIETPADHAPYVGFDLGSDPASIGLTKIASGGGLTAYSVGTCNRYQYPDGRLISLGQEAMFKRLASTAPAGMSVAGDPYTGAIFAGILSHRVGVYQKFAVPTDFASALVGLKFDTYQSDWLVCAAVKSLKIGVVVTGRSYRGATSAARAPFVGFDDIAAIPGLTAFDTGGGATAYSVGTCGGE